MSSAKPAPSSLRQRKALSLLRPDPDVPALRQGELFRLGLAARLRAVIGSDSFRDVAQRTGFNHETVRRYLNGASEPGAEFLACFITAYQLSPGWVLFERGGPTAASMTRDALAEAGIDDLLGEVADRLSPLTDRQRLAPANAHSEQAGGRINL